MFYVGKTIHCDKRLAQHVSCRDANTAKNEIIAQIKGSGMLPVMRIVELCGLQDWAERERHWIKFYRDKGVRITNISNGDGTSEATRFLAHLRLFRPDIDARRIDRISDRDILKFAIIVTEKIFQSVARCIESRDLRPVKDGRAIVSDAFSEVSI